jgi:hypothetical protein
MISRHLGSAILHQRSKACQSVTNNADVILRFKSTKTSASQTGSLFDSANGYFSALRWSAANALTSSLPEDERNQLLQKLGPKLEDKPNEEESTVPQRSIDEAVAAARAQEAEIHSEKWEIGKEKLLADAEAAARARVESDLMIQKRQLAFEAWKRDLEREKGQAASTEEEQVGNHPILGPILLDLGHKRIHVASAKALASIPVWKKQRVYRHERAKTMVSDKLKTLHLGLPGIIGIYEVSIASGI